MYLLTLLRGHCDDLQADILLHLELALAEDGDDLGDLLHHVANVLTELVHRDGLTHHRSQARLKGHQVGGNL